MRLLTTHIYKLFENTEPLNKTAQVGGNVEKLSVFSMCYSVESTPPSIQEYRAQQNTLQKMVFNTTQYTLIKDTDFQLYPLNYMLGVLFMNFKLLWEPVIEFIASYGNSLATDEFWPTFHKALETAFANAKRDLKQFKFDDEFSSEFEVLQELYAEYNNIPERPDVYNYRDLLLKVMTNCIQVCEARNRDVVVLFLNFIEEEYKRTDNANALKIDVETRNDTAMEIDEDKPDEVNVEESIDIIEDTKETVSGKVTFRTLINVMQVLAQFKNPRALHKEPIFWELYMEFLKHKNAGLQKFALDCVMNYKNKSVVAYKSNLYNLVDDKKFKDELTLFKITEDAQSIHAEDREHVIPIILRILYGKMTSKMATDKKGGGQTRRSLIMRYVAGCNEKELKIFIEMAFSHVKHYMAMEPREIYESIVSTLDLKSVIIPGKLHSILNLLEVVREYFGGYLKDELLSDVLKVFLFVCSTVGGVLSHGEKVHVGYSKVMKNLRTIAIGILTKMFDQFDKYTWKTDELYVLFETLIWPLLSKLHIEGIHSPTVLLKLLSTWCHNPRYYPLLVTYSEKEPLLSPVPEIFKLMLAPRTSPVVVNMILDMVEKLLTLTEDEEDKELPALVSFNNLPIENKPEVKVEMNFGSKILVPHIPSILEVMKRRIANSAKSNTMNKRDLLILSRVTELVASPELCDDLLNLLLPILVRKVCLNMSEDNMEHAVNTIINLLGHSSNPQHYIKTIAVLFNKISPVDVRKLLLKLLSSIAEAATKNKDTLTRISKVISEMNAFNKRWIEQPDFDRRLDAYREIYKLIDNNEIDLDLAILIVNNCFYFIRTEKDIGLRDSASLCLKRILPKLLLKYWSATDGQYLVRDTVLSLISSGIRDSKNEILRNECINLLGELARECPTTDVVLSDLNHLTNKEDREVDFFDNMSHLQMHRRVRALMKFCKVAKKMGKCPSPRTLTNFILPLATTYICDDKYTDKNTLIDACIEVISTCCRLLPWYHYEVILKLYLNKMRHSSEYQKQLTRLVVGIIDAFHFDFSKAKNIELPKALMANVDNRKPINKNSNKEREADKSLVNGSINNKNIDDEKKEENATKEENDENEGDETATDENGEITEIDLDSELKAADDEVSIEEPELKDASNVPAFERSTQVPPSLAKRIINSLSSGLLPQLNR